MRKTVEEVLEEYAPKLMSISGVNGVCIEDAKGVPYIKVFVARNAPNVRKELPENIEGYRVEVEEIGDIHPLND